MTDCSAVLSINTSARSVFYDHGMVGVNGGGTRYIRSVVVLSSIAFVVVSSKEIAIDRKGCGSKAKSYTSVYHVCFRQSRSSYRTSLNAQIMAWQC